jgi:hypothetical protein
MVEISSGLMQDIERFLAMGGGSFALLLDMCGGAQPPETPPMGTASQTPGRRSLTPSPIEAALDKEGG